MLNVYIANLGKYNEGYLVGKWVTLPCDDLEAEIESIGVADGTEYEELAIHDFETDLPIKVTEYSSLSDLNDMAQKLEDLSEYDRNKLLAYIEVNGSECFDDGLEKLDDMTLYEDIKSAYDLGYMMFNETSGIPKEYHWITQYFDFEEYGQGYLDDNYDLTDYGCLSVNY